MIKLYEHIPCSCCTVVLVIRGSTKAVPGIGWQLDESRAATEGVQPIR